MLNVMSYNFYGPWSSYTGQNSPLYASAIETAYEKKYLNLNSSVHLWVDAGAPPEKINVGMAFFGRSYTLLNESDHGLHAPFNKSKTASYTYRQVGMSSLFSFENSIPVPVNQSERVFLDTLSVFFEHSFR